MNNLPFNVTIYHGPARLDNSERITKFWFNALIVLTIAFSMAGAWIDFVFFFGAAGTSLIFALIALIPRRKRL